MISGPFREVDYDLLADYIGGALDGTPEAVALAERVRDDPAWCETYASLAPAMEHVRINLVKWGSSRPVMPGDIEQRLTKALHQARPRMAGQRRQRVRGMRSRRLALVVAAAMVLLAGLGVTRLTFFDSHDDMTSSTVSAESGHPQSAPGQPRAIFDPGAGRLLATGTDYTPNLLTQAAPATAGGVSSPQRSHSSSPERRIPSGLARLSRPDTLAVCLDQIAAEHGREPVTVDLVDYATFGGQPALVVRFGDSHGLRWVWVAGPECGVAASGADTRYRVTVR